MGTIDEVRILKEIIRKSNSQAETTNHILLEIALDIKIIKHAILKEIGK